MLKEVYRFFLCRNYRNSCKILCKHRAFLAFFALVISTGVNIQKNSGKDVVKTTSRQEKTRELENDRTMVQKNHCSNPVFSHFFLRQVFSPFHHLNSKGKKGEAYSFFCLCRGKPKRSNENRWAELSRIRINLYSGHNAGASPRYLPLHVVLQVFCVYEISLNRSFLLQICSMRKRYSVHLAQSL